MVKGRSRRFVASRPAADSRIRSSDGMQGVNGAELAQGRHPAFADHPVGILADHAEHAHDAAGVVAKRAVREGVVALLGIAGPFEKQQKRRIPRRLAGREHPLDAWADVIPDLGPDLTGRSAERPRILSGESVAAVGGVAEEGQLGTPRHPHGEPRREKNPHCRLQAQWPDLGGPEGGCFPVDLREIATDLGVGAEDGAVGERRGDALRRPQLPPTDPLAQCTDTTCDQPAAASRLTPPARYRDCRRFDRGKVEPYFRSAATAASSVGYRGTNSSTLVSSIGRRVTGPSATTTTGVVSSTACRVVTRISNPTDARKST